MLKTELARALFYLNILSFLIILCSIELSDCSITVCSCLDFWHMHCTIHDNMLAQFLMLLLFKIVTGFMETVPNRTLKVTS